ncbi:hypothetical protein CRUP_027560 [Coryphaenoides rupestris]|nr:hypothetical protein CRUP_027560 [Coryphaenoides rupestris]
MENGLPTTGDLKLDQDIKTWLSYDKNPKTASQVKALVQAGDVDRLRRCFSSRMVFGTAGLRAAMGPGVSRMNDLTIIQTTQGFCRYLEQCFADLKERGVPFAVSHLGLCAGVMVTASHNPKEDNGYKVYWDNGAQIVSPHDKGIATAIEENLEPWPQAWDTEEALKSPLLKGPFEDIHTQYFRAIQQHCHHRDINKNSEVKIVHTSVHGVGHTFVQAAFKAFDLRPPFAETLTGFKWMGNRARELLNDGKSILYGYHITKNSYYICHDQDVIRSLFQRLRNYGDQKDSYPTECGGFSISAVRDLTTGYDSNQPDKKAVLPTSSSSQMITFSFSNGGVATMRTSGTEPKIKYYTELCAAPGNSDVGQLQKELDNLVTAIVENFFEPEKNKLQPKPE